ncbi:MAG TPA: AarF/ABC1/UbiB kinase family protein [Planctomycetota bacterium]|nr:AarF/ABC1/UbiB kinase family protein [Planctomycetota bacterium]
MKRGRPLPAGAAGRLVRIGVTGAAVLGRQAVGRLKSFGASAERRDRIAAETHEANAIRLVDAMSGLRGAFMKLGQMLSQQAHSLPEPYLRRLAELQWQAPPMHGTLMRIQVRNELGAFPEALFAGFEREPFAAASLGQVHRARLASGQRVAVKIQYPGIERSLDSDFANLKTLLGALGLSREQHGDVWAAVEEIRSHFASEVDYVREADHLEEFRRLMPDVRIPAVHRAVSSRRVLTMDLLEGRHLPDYLRRRPPQAERDALGTRLLDLFLRQSLRLGRLHADPHPGNYLFQDDGGIALLDFGCVKRFEPGFVEEHRKLFRIRIGDRASLEAHFRPHRPRGEPDARWEKKMDALLKMQALDIAKYQDDRPFDFGDASHVREVIGTLQSLARLGLMTPGFVLYVRAKVGLYNLLNALGARVRCGRVLEAYL